MNKTIYIAGPITGMKNMNREAFYEAAMIVKKLGLYVRNPHEFCSDIPQESDWNIYMRRCLTHLAECTDIILLPGWKHSQGANLEKHISEQLGLKIHYGIGSFYTYLEEIAEREAV